MTTSALCPRISAENTLGVDRNATASQVRQAWKNRAFEMHPDRGVGTDAEFSAINNAYNFLKDPSSAEAKSPSTQPNRRPKQARPAARTRVIDLNGDSEAACGELFASADVNSTDPSTDHVANKMRQKGRRISYGVEGPLAVGINRVAVPTGALVDGRKVLPIIVSMATNTAGSSIYAVPENIRAALFPGAKSVRIHFANAQW